MEATVTFDNSLAEALDKRKKWLEKAAISKLKDEYRIFQASYTGLYTILLKKGVIHEDPYKHENRIGDLKLPAEGPFSESERTDQMSVRLSDYAAQLDFLINFYQISVDSLSMENLRKLVALTKYFTWTQFSAGSQNINTRTLVELVNMAKSSNDTLTPGIIADCLIHLDRSSKTIFAQLKEISDYQRENYKLELRLRVMDSLKFDAATVITRKDESHRQIKRKFQEAMPDRHFYPELVDEILHEDYAGDGQAQKDALLKKLAIVEDKPKDSRQTVSHRVTLMDGLRILGTLNFTLGDVLTKMQENSALLESSKNSFGEKLRRLLRQVMGKEAEELIYEIEYFDPVTASSKQEKLAFKAFCEDLDRKLRFYASLNNKTSSTVKKLDAATEDQVLGALSKNIEELQSMHKTLTALDLFFKSETQKEMRERLRGIKPELSAIKNSIVKANQKRHEFIAHKEEQDQMQRLGITGDAV